MERAVALSESMDARGFGNRGPVRAEVEAGWCALVALLALAGGFVALVGRAPLVAGICAAVGVVALVAGVARASGATRRQHYRRRALTGGDWSMIAVSVLAPVAVGLFAAAGNDTLAWYASPVTWPRFDPLVALAVLPLLAPLARRPRTRTATSAPADLVPTPA
jgi:energy-coupling factor transport system permease protein